jgi:hypothetical protein
MLSPLSTLNAIDPPGTLPENLLNADTIFHYTRNIAGNNLTKSGNPRYGVAGMHGVKPFQFSGWMRPRTSHP